MKGFVEHINEGFHICEFKNNKSISWTVKVEIPKNKVGQPTIFEKHRDLNNVISEIFEYFLVNKNYKKYNTNSICEKYKEYNNKLLKIKHVNVTLLRNISYSILISLLNTLKGIGNDFIEKDLYKDYIKVKLLPKGVIVYDETTRMGYYGDDFIFLPYDYYELVKNHIGLKNTLAWADTNIIKKMEVLSFYKTNVLIKIFNSLIKKCKLDEDVEEFLIFTANKQIIDIRYNKFSSDLPF